MLKFYLDFWVKNRESLLDGKLTAENPENGYSLIKSELDGRAVITAYAKNDVNISEVTGGSIINASGRDYIIVLADRKMKFTVYDCMGNVVSADVLTGGILKFFVPRCGLLCFNEWEN